MAAVYLAVIGRNAAVAAIVGLLNNGTIDFYNGTMPTDLPSDLASFTKLGTVTFGSTAFGDPSNGTATAAAITADTSADNTGTCTWARVKTSGGNTMMDLDVTLTGGGGSITVNNTSFRAGAKIEVTSMTITLPAS
jgi:hypothetical protein